MDLSKIMSAGPPAQGDSDSRASRHAPDEARRTAPLGPPPPAAPSAAYGPGPQAGGGLPPTAAATPLFGPPSQDFRTPSASHPPQKGLTPLQTPGHAYSNGYPFPAQSVQSPSVGSAHRPYPETHPTAALTPGSGQRPPNQQYRLSPDAYQHHPTVTQGVQSAIHSMSPTPSSHRSAHTPNRNSPLSRMHYQPMHPQNYSQPPQSQPSTPLVPPHAHRQRSSAHSSQADTHSPFHQRRYSGASANGYVLTESPGMYQPGISRMVESPPAAYRQSPHMRRSSDRVSSERERSVSVSPRTIPLPRPPSLGSRQSSAHETFSARSSVTAAPPMHPPTTQQSQPLSLSHQPSYASQPSQQHIAVRDVTQSPLRHSQMQLAPSQNIGPAQTPEPTMSHAQLFESSRPGTVHSSSARLSMKHLLAPATDESPPSLPTNGPVAGSLAAQTSLETPSRSRSLSLSHPSQEVQTDRYALPSQHALLQQPLHSHTTPVTNGNHSEATMATESKKRHADSEAPEQPPQQKVKRTQRSRMPGQRPPWAILCKDNPFAGDKADQAVQPNNAARREAHSNGTPSNANTATITTSPDAPPWQHDPPLDHDLIEARSIFGKWEKSFSWNTALPDLQRAVQDWLFSTLAQNADIGLNALEGNIEIEAKIGTILNADTNERWRCPALSAFVIPPDYNKNLRFESQMDESAHESLNKYLNGLVQQSFRPGRVTMQYEHLYEIDTFAVLSETGLKALPPSAVKRRFQHKAGTDIKLRTTINNNPKKPHEQGQVKARIVKLPLADLHIYNPSAYDCRISMNLEVNLDRPGLDPLDLTEQSTESRPAPPARQKDRLSYKHLCYSVDLTRVEVKGTAPKYELELEVDSALLRHHMEMLQQGQHSGFGHIVGGFMEDLSFLMRARAGAK